MKAIKRDGDGDKAMKERHMRVTTQSLEKMESTIHFTALLNFPLLSSAASSSSAGAQQQPLAVAFSSPAASSSSHQQHHHGLD